MTDELIKRAFISYVKEDKERVDGLCRILDAASIPYWRDRHSLAPGDAWKAKIRDAIRSGSLVFLACFSDRSVQREASYMNEEIVLAVDEFRKRPPERTWLIPVRFSDVVIPDWDLGAGRTLHDIQHCDLFGEKHAQEAVGLVSTIARVLGTATPDQASAMASIAEAADEERLELLRRLTKQMVTDPARRIELDELIGAEVRRILNAMRNPDTFPTTLTSASGSSEEQVTEVASTAIHYVTLALPFCASLQVAARWADPDALGPWVSGLSALCREAGRPQSGTTTLVAMRWVPALLATFTAGLSAISATRFHNLKALIVDNTVTLERPEGRVSIIEAVHPWRPFRDTGDIVPNVIARSVREHEDPVTAYEAFTSNSVGKYHTPIAEWLHATLRPLFDEQFHDDASYDIEFDRTEIFLGLISQDLAAEKSALDASPTWSFRSVWFGRSTWRNRHSQTSSMDEVRDEYASQGPSWAPLAAGLFGEKEDRLERALTGYAESYDELRRTRF